MTAGNTAAFRYLECTYLVIDANQNVWTPVLTQSGYLYLSGPNGNDGSRLDASNKSQFSAGYMAGWGARVYENCFASAISFP